MTSLPLREAAPYVLGPGSSVRDAVQRLESTGGGIVLLVDDGGRLSAVITDGDLRRAVLTDLDLDSPAMTIATTSPVTAKAGAGRRVLMSLFRERGIRHVPIVDAACRPTHVAMSADVAGTVRTQPVVIMAGGRGTRLGSLTAETPKPMIEVGGRPILETIVDQLAADGFATLLIAVNYQAQRIEDHFRDGSRFGVHIEYVREREPLGTAGAIRLAADSLDSTFLVINADLLTSASFADLVDAHEDARNAITIGVSDVDVELRYGVVDIDEQGRVQGFREKPKMKVTANAGVYVVEPELVSLVPEGASTMPDLVGRVLERGLQVGSYPMRGLWLDIGELNDLQRAHAVYERLTGAGETA